LARNGAHRALERLGERLWRGAKSGTVGKCNNVHVAGGPTDVAEQIEGGSSEDDNGKRPFGQRQQLAHAGQCEFNVRATGIIKVHHVIIKITCGTLIVNL
jgi:hypothetical protein